jgi:glucokinase
VRCRRSRGKFGGAVNAEISARHLLKVRQNQLAEDESPGEALVRKEAAKCRSSNRLPGSGARRLTCVATSDTFVSILAGKASNVLVKVLATGGVYMAGGVVTHTPAALQRPRFVQAFIQKGRFQQLTTNIPVQVVVSHAGLAGAAVRGLEN